MNTSVEQDLELPDWWPADEEGVKYGESFFDPGDPPEEDVPDFWLVDVAHLAWEKFELAIQAKDWAQMSFYARKLYRQRIDVVFAGWARHSIEEFEDLEATLQLRHQGFLEELKSAINEDGRRLDDPKFDSSEWLLRTATDLESQLEALLEESSSRMRRSFLESLKLAGDEGRQSESPLEPYLVGLTEPERITLKSPHFFDKGAEFDLQEIADMARVSKRAVSYYRAQSPKLANAKKAKILKAIEELRTNQSKPRVGEEYKESTRGFAIA